MNITIEINGISKTLEIKPHETLLKILRREEYFGVKFGGCRNGECGACTVLLDGKPVNACSILAAQAGGHKVETIETLGENPDQGWKKSGGLHPIQKAFVETGAIQCGFCTPAMILATKALLEKNNTPSEKEIREALSGILCRCTGYVKPVQAVQRAAAYLRGEEVLPVNEEPLQLPSDWMQPLLEKGDSGENGVQTIVRVMPKVTLSPDRPQWKSVNQPVVKVDAAKLVQGKPAFAGDMHLRGMLFGKMLTSPYAHALIKKIDVSKARALPGVAAVLTWMDIPRVAYSTAGQSDPIPAPLDGFSLDKKVRFVGDRVAFLAAKTLEIANQAIKLIEVEYEILPPVLEMEDATKPGAAIIHDEPEFINFGGSNPKKNLAAELSIDIGNVEQGFAEADQIFEADYIVPKVQQVHIEPHVVITYWDEDDRLVIRSSTQIPFHVRRVLSPVLNLPVKRIRVIKPRIGGGFGGKQEVLMEDIPAHLTIATGRPVFFEYTREEEFTSARSRHPMHLHMKTGVKKDGTITANEMRLISDTGAYGSNALPVVGNTGHKSMAFYVGDGKYRESPNIRFCAEVVYTNHAPAGAYRGYGVPQGYWAVDRHMEKIARALGLDLIEFRMKNAIRAGEIHPFSRAWSEGREPHPEIVNTVGLEECVHQGKAAIGWDQKYNNPSWHSVPGKPHLRKGIGIATVMQGTAIPYLDMGGASIKLNDDGSFNLLIGATDLGTGSDTVLAQMAAEVLGSQVEDIIVYSSDTDFTPFDKGAYASSTTYISGTAVVKAAQIVAERIRLRAADMLNAKTPDSPLKAEEIQLREKMAFAPDNRSVTLAEIALNSLHHTNQEQIMGVASYMSPVSPPPFVAQFAEVTVDTGTGQVTVDKLVIAEDSGVIINPITASGQIEGGVTQALGYGVCEEMRYDKNGQPLDKNLIDYHIFRSNEMPEMETILVETFEPSHPFGVKAVGEVPINAAAPAIGNAIVDACGANIDEIPAIPERVWRALQKPDKSGFLSITKNS